MGNFIKDKEIILFDLDGTISDPKIGITRAVQYALKEFGITVDNLDDLCKFIGPPLKESFEMFYNFNEEEVKRAIEKYREYFKDTGIYENELYDGMDELLNNLVTMGKQLVIATSKPIVFANRILEYFNVSKYFQFVSGSEMDGTRIKKAEVICYALEKINVKDLSKTVMIGDREHDIFGAKAAGIDSIGVLYGYGDRDEFIHAGATVIVETVEELAQCLGAK
jgi:phosphoglycolate phosphatase